MCFLSVVQETESVAAVVNASRKRIQTLRKLSEMNANEFVTETGNVIEKETVIVSAGVAVPGRGTENVIVETETERGIGGTENVIEEKGSDNMMCVFYYYFILFYF